MNFFGRTRKGKEIELYNECVRSAAAFSLQRGKETERKRKFFFNNIREKPSFQQKKRKDRKAIAFPAYFHFRYRSSPQPTHWQKRYSPVGAAPTEKKA